MWYGKWLLPWAQPPGWRLGYVVLIYCFSKGHRRGSGRGPVGREGRRRGKGISALKKGFLGTASGRMQRYYWGKARPCMGGFYSFIRTSGSRTNCECLTPVLGFSKLLFEYAGLSQLGASCGVKKLNVETEDLDY